MRAKRQKHSGAFKAKVTIEALQERETLVELSKKYGIHPNQIIRWKKDFLERAPRLFEKSQPTDDHEKEMEKMFAKIAQLEMERDYFKRNLKKKALKINVLSAFISE